MFSATHAHSHVVSGLREFVCRWQHRHGCEFLVFAEIMLE